MPTQTTLKKRILRGYLVPLVLLVLVSVALVMMAVHLQGVTDSVKSAQDIVLASTSLESDTHQAQAAARGLLLNGGEDDRRALAESRQSYDANRLILRQLVKDSSQLALMERLDGLRAQVVQRYEREIELLDSGHQAEAIAALKTGQGSTLSNEIEVSTAQFVEAERKILEERTAEQVNSLRLLVIIVVGATATAIIISLFSAVRVASSISETLSEAIGDMTTSTVQIAATVDEHEHSVTQQAAAVSETTSTVEELEASSSQSASQAESTSSSAKQALEVALEGGRLSEEVVDNMGEVQKKVGSVAEQILKLSEQAGQIGEIARVVGELAGETNMLALNAAVEAARAGEQGKGFAVVATEVRKLAAQSKKSAERTNGIVSEIQRSINSAVMVADEGNRAVGQAAQVTRKTVDAFEEIASVARDVAVSTQQVLLNSKQQAIALSQVTEAMKSLTAGSQQIAVGTKQTQIGVQKLNEVATGLKALV